MLETLGLIASLFMAYTPDRLEDTSTPSGSARLVKDIENPTIEGAKAGMSLIVRANFDG